MQPDLPEALFDLYAWDQLTLRECEVLARRVATSLPPSFHFVGMTIHEVGSHNRHIGLFEKQATPQDYWPRSFALIPGGTVTLGYDRTQRLLPPEEFVREWQEQHLEHYGDSVTIDGALERDIRPTNYDAFYDYLNSKLLPLRTVTLQPFLLETIAVEARQVLPSSLITRGSIPSIREGEKHGYFRYSGHGTISQRSVVTFVKQQGFRLPTSDEWEYACSAGTRTLFYWGNGSFVSERNAADTPTQHHPFGLQIADDPNRWEYCDDPTIMRGGDGGKAICGGAGTLAESLPLASAYYHQLDANETDRGLSIAFFRRVYDLVQADRAISVTES
jgi:hypothetical protein